MGGSSESVTIGYRYYAGMHLSLCHGPIDFVRRVEVGDKVAWSGIIEGGQFIIENPWLFGGDAREGGISGAVDLLSGGPEQGQNDYLASKLDADKLPNFRGVCTAVLRHMYLGMNPYVKPWKFRAQRIHNAQNGELQWYDEKAPIGVLQSTPLSLYFALDFSGSMSGTRRNTLVAAMNKVLDFIGQNVGYLKSNIDIMVLAFTGKGSITRRGVSLTDIQEIKTWIGGLGASGGTDYYNGVSAAPSFFNNSDPCSRKLLFFVTDGEPTSGFEASLEVIRSLYWEVWCPSYSIFSAEVYAINIESAGTSYTSQMDNTPSDGVPVVTSSNVNALAQIIKDAITGYLDMNPAHIIRECLTNSEWGMGVSPLEIDDDSFTYAADILYDEGMGISILWDKENTIDDLVSDVLRHIEGDLAIDNTTGRFRLKLVRDDFDASTLPVLDPSNIYKIQDFHRLAMADLINEVIVEYWDSELGAPRTAAVQNVAMAQVQGSPVTAKVDYFGFTNNAVAAKVAARDLKTLSYPRVTCTLYVNRLAAQFTKGDVFKLSWPDYGIISMIMRITSMDIGDGINNMVKIECTQDTFYLPEVSLILDPIIRWEDPRDDIGLFDDRLIFEVPYLEIVQNYGQAEVDSILSSYPEIGYVGAAVTGTTGAVLAARLHTDSGAGYVEYGNFQPCPSALIVNDIGPMDTVIEFSEPIDMDLIVLGSWAQINDELIAVDLIYPTSILVRRGVLDTVPVPHAAGSIIFFWDNHAGSDEQQYALSDSIDVKIQPIYASSGYPVANTPEDVIIMNQRAFRPYPPGNFKINDRYYPYTIISEGGIIYLTWSHRDRIQQTVAPIGHTVGDIGPEVGTTYKVQIYIEDILLATIVDITGTSTSVLPPQNGLVKIEVYSVRDGIDSWQPARHEFDYSAIFIERCTEEDILRVIEDDVTGRVLEDSSGLTLYHDWTFPVVYEVTIRITEDDLIVRTEDDSIRIEETT